MAARAQFYANAKPLEPTMKVLKMLFRQDFGGSHQRHIKPTLQSHERGAGRDNSFSRTHVTLEQSPHGRPGPEVTPDFPEHMGLSASQLETQIGKERFDQMIVSLTRIAHRSGLEIATALLNCKLQT